MKSGSFGGLDFFQHSSSEALAIKLSTYESEGEPIPMFEDQNGVVTILCQNIESMEMVRGAFLYAIRILDQHINNN
jgi:hypothetical protein